MNVVLSLWGSGSESVNVDAVGELFCVAQHLRLDVTAGRLLCLSAFDFGSIHVPRSNVLR